MELLNSVFYFIIRCNQGRFSVFVPWAFSRKCCSSSCSAPFSASTRSGWGRGHQEGWCYSGWRWGWLLHRRLREGVARCWATAPSHSPVSRGKSRRRWPCMYSERGLDLEGSCVSQTLSHKHVAQNHTCICEYINSKERCEKQLVFIKTPSREKPMRCSGRLRRCHESGFLFGGSTFLLLCSFL